jgi:hypothetical protein
LVVIAIIVVLLALLTPAVDRAMYVAELTVCATRQAGIVRGVNLYAMDHARYYPPRFWNTANRQPHKIAGVTNPTDPGNASTPFADDRPAFRGYIGFNLLVDPLTKRVELENTAPNADVYAPYKMWFGWRYVDTDPPAGAKAGMTRMGQPFEWKGQPFRVMVGDSDEYSPNRVLSNHMDQDGKLQPWVFENSGGVGGVYANLYLSMWVRYAVDRGLLDLNFADDDGSVQRLSNLKLNDDERTVKLPEYTPANTPTVETNGNTRVPR